MSCPYSCSVWVRRGTCRWSAPSVLLRSWESLCYHMLADLESTQQRSLQQWNNFRHRLTEPCGKSAWHSFYSVSNSEEGSAAKTNSMASSGDKWIQTEQRWELDLLAILVSSGLRTGSRPLWPVAFWLFRFVCVTTIMNSKLQAIYHGISMVWLEGIRKNHGWIRFKNDNQLHLQWSCAHPSLLPYSGQDSKFQRPELATCFPTFYEEGKPVCLLVGNKRSIRRESFNLFWCMPASSYS